MNTRCVVVIGHVDHGKTALVRTLTGIETDRLPEEKARGLSILPGFAHRTYPDGVIDFVDAPGHADFVQAMISGASGAQAALVVISLVEGMQAQTREHLDIAGLLGITHVVVAVTKSDLLGPSDRAAQLSEILASLAQTPFSSAPIVACSAHSGEGIKDLDDALMDLLAHSVPQTNVWGSFLPIDRAFSLPGHGTIVTGTLLGQDLTKGADLVLQPLARTVSIRSLQSRGAVRDAVQTGERVAVNLRGITPKEIPSGSVLCATGIGTPTDVVDAYLALLPAQTKPLKHMQQVRVLFGTTSAVAQLRLMKDQGGATSFAQLRFQKPVACFAGQRAILRSLSPVETLGRATFLDPQAHPTTSGDTARLEVLKASQESDTRGIAKALIKAGGGCAKLSDVSRLARLCLAQTRASLGDEFINLDCDTLTSAEDVSAARTAMLDALAAYHLKHPLRGMAPRAAVENRKSAFQVLQYVEDLAVADGQCRRQADMLALWDHDPVAQLSGDQRDAIFDLENTFRHAGLDAVLPATGSQNAHLGDYVDFLLETGSLVSLPNIALKRSLIFHAETLSLAATTLLKAFPQQQSFTTSQARVALDTSRRVIVPVLEHFDSLGVTIRQNDTRQIVALNLVSPAPPSC